MNDPREDLKAATRRYQRTEQAHEQERTTTIEKVVAALRAKVPPTEVVELSPFTAAYVRRIAREHGIPPAAPGPKKAGQAG